MDRGEDDPVPLSVEEGGGEGEPAPHVAEGVVPDDGDPGERGPDLGPQAGRLGVPERGGALDPVEPGGDGGQPAGEDEADEEGERRDEDGDDGDDLHDVRR